MWNLGTWFPGNRGLDWCKGERNFVKGEKKGKREEKKEKKKKDSHSAAFCDKFCFPEVLKKRDKTQQYKKALFLIIISKLYGASRAQIADAHKISPLCHFSMFCGLLFKRNAIKPNRLGEPSSGKGV